LIKVERLLDQRRVLAAPLSCRANTDKGSSRNPTQQSEFR
jgi:hypothetical protein